MNGSPALSWTGGTTETKSFAVVFYDTGFNMLHWVLWDIPATVKELSEGLPTAYELSNPPGVHQAANTGSDTHGYYGRLLRKRRRAVEAAKLASVVWSGKSQ